MHGCFGNGVAGENQTSSNSNFTDSEKLYLYSLFLNEYLWYDKVATNVDLDIYTSRNIMIRSLRYSPFDRWSIAVSKEDYDAFANQKTFGFGFSYNSDLKVIDTRIGSPSHQKLFRGDKIIALNGAPATEQTIYNASNNLGVATTFGVLRNSSEINVTVTPAYYDYNVTLAKVVEFQGDKIGYLRYDEFTPKSIYEIENAFHTFSSEKIDELVIDLRYNGGGALALISILLDNLLNRSSDTIQFKLVWNDKNQDKNSIYKFKEFEKIDGVRVGNELSLSKVYLLVTKDSASASEALILALKSLLGEENVILIGSETHGKGVGMLGRYYQPSRYYYFLINFKIESDSGEIVPVEGFGATCLAKDDIDNERGDPNEQMLKTALYYMQYEECPIGSSKFYGIIPTLDIHYDNNTTSHQWTIIK